MGLLRKTYFTQATDQDLVKKFKEEDDMESLGLLFNRYITQVYGLCFKYFKQGQDSEDAVMTIFELLTVKLKKHEVEYFKSWLYTLSKNYCLEQLRKANKTLTKETEAGLMYTQQIFHPDNVVNEIELENLTKCLKGLPGLQKKCTELFYLKKHSYDEIAKLLKLNWSSVRSYIQNGRRNLKNCMEKNK